ncbi:zinc finger BED domain-containing protein RICESLEEPER 2-like protein [Tanacetum coccineum]
MVKEGIVLGHKISKNGIEVDKAKVDVIAKLPHPTIVKGVWSFLAFQTFKKKLTEAPILIAPDWDLPFELMCDASDFAIGAVLGQRHEKHFRPIHYASKTMNEAESHYTTTEKEIFQGEIAPVGSPPSRVQIQSIKGNIPVSSVERQTFSCLCTQSMKLGLSEFLFREETPDKIVSTEMEAGNEDELVVDVDEMLADIGRTIETLNFKPSSLGQSGSSLVTHSFSQEKCRKSIARMCIKDNQPFSIVDDEGFREFVWDLNCEFKIPSRWTVARDCLSLFQEEKIKLKHLLKNQTVCLTTDTWTSVQNYNYMCLTAHWIDEKWNLKKKILNFCQIANHKGVTIGKLVYRCLQDWGIDRVFTITVDNASSNDGAIKFLKTLLKGPNSVLDCKYLHLRCCAHIINLVVREGLEEHITSVDKIRNAVRYLRSSPGRLTSFEESVEFEKIDCGRKPCLDVDTRWNSTFLMLETALKFQSAFDRLQVIDPNYRSYFRNEVEDVRREVLVLEVEERKMNDRVLGASR